MFGMDPTPTSLKDKARWLLETPAASLLGQHTLWFRRIGKQLLSHTSAVVSLCRPALQGARAKGFQPSLVSNKKSLPAASIHQVDTVLHPLKGSHGGQPPSEPSVAEMRTDRLHHFQRTSRHKGPH